MTAHEAFQPLLLLMIVAVAIPLLFKRLDRFLRVPIVVGEIIAGIAVGRSGLGILEETPHVTFLADFGFIFLMFLSGLELDFGSLLGRSRDEQQWRAWQRPVGLATLNFAGTLLLAVLVSAALWRSGMTRNPLLLGLILSTTSLGIVVPVLKERELIGTPYGQCLLFAALISDFFPMLLLGLILSVLSKGFSWNLLLFLVLLAAFVAAARVTRWVNRHAIARRVLDELSHATAQIRVRGTFALIVLWVVMAGSLGVEVILGAFLAGATIAQGRRGVRGDLEKNLDAIGYGFFIPIFFVMVGARFDVSALSGSTRALWLAPMLVGASYAVNLIPALILRARFSWRESFAGGALLASRLSLAIAAAAIAFKLDLISSGTNSAIILVAIFTCTVSPILFNRLAPVRPDVERRGVIIVGTDFLAEFLARRLIDEDEPICIIGRDAVRLESLRAGGFTILDGAPDDEDILKRAGADRARALIALSNDADLVRRICERAAEKFHVPTIVARAEFPEDVRRLQALAVRVVQPAMAMALAVEGTLRFPSTLSSLTEQDERFALVEVPLENATLVGMPLRKIHLQGDALVLGVRRQGQAEVVVPHGDTVLRFGDILVLCGHSDALAKVSQQFGA